MPGRDDNVLPAPAGGWVQANVALRRRDGDAVRSARAVFAAIVPVVAALRRAGVLSHFFFMRKPPDLRLRLHARTPEEAYRRLAVVLERLGEAGSVQRFFPSVYEPEVRLFGGPEAMALTHDYFDADTAAWWELDQLRAAGRARLPVGALATAVMDDLFQRTLRDRGEVWDAWSSLAALVGPPPAVTPPAVTPPAPPSLDSLEAVAEPEERPLLARYAGANEALSGGLTRTWGEGRLGVGLRALLPYHAMFHFHRCGLKHAQQAAVAASMAEAWDAYKGLRGSDN